MGLGVGLGASALGAGGAALLAVLALACGRHLLAQWEAGLLAGDLEVSHALESLALAATGLVAAWLALLVLMGAVASLPGGSAAPLRAAATRLAPHLAPRVSAVLVTAAVTVLPVGVAHGAPEAGHLGPQLASAADQGASGRDADTGAPEPGWRPTAPAPSPDPSVISLVSRGGAEPEAVVVRSGDTLWDIAARHLGDDADAAAIAAAWPLWYSENRELIGPDPDHLLPGTHLVPPEPAGADS